MKEWKILLAKFDRKFCFYILSLILPLLLLPLALSPLKESRCLYALLFTACFWILEPVPIYVSGLLPIVLLPLLGILSSSEVCANYMREIAMLILGSLIMALAVEECKLHERIALKILLLLGTELKWLLLGVMLSTMFMSMWMMNTAVTAMILPIVEAILKKIHRNDAEQTAVTNSSLTENDPLTEKEEDVPPTDECSFKRQEIAFLLSICYAANIGGTGTMIGTGSGFAWKGLMDEYFPGCDEINFTSWMMYHVPGMLVCTLIGWIYLWRFYLRKSIYASSLKTDLNDVITKKYKELGPLTCSQIEVLTLFIVLLLLWFTRDPKIITGWSTWIGFDKKVGAAVPVIAAAFLLFMLPSEIRNFKSGPVLKWKKVQKNIPWGLLMLCGGGFALADAAQKSGLSKVIEKYMSTIEVLPSSLIALVISLATAAATEILSNIATTIILFPIVSQMAVAMRINPLYVLIPLVNSSSYAFMLPVATPPNAIVFASGSMKTMDMVKPGIFMNLMCCAVQMLMINSIGVAMFDVHNFPRWADNTVIIDPKMLSNQTISNSTAVL